MFFTTLALVGLASAGPISIATRQTQASGGTYPETSTGTAFKLVMHVANPTLDFDPPINNMEVTAYHIGAAQNAPSVSAEGGEVFYQQFSFNTSHYNGSPRSTYSTLAISHVGPIVWTVMPRADPEDTTPQPVKELELPVGGPAGGKMTTGFEVAWESWPWAQFWGPGSMNPGNYGTFLACQQPEAAPMRPEVVIKFVEMSDEYGELEDFVPQGCIVVDLFAQCDTIGERPVTLPTWEEEPEMVQCYEDVAGIDWSQFDYPPRRYEFQPLDN